MGERMGLGSLGRRLLAALMLTAAVAILIMVAGMLITEQRIRSMSATGARTAIAEALAAEAATAYSESGGWAAALIPTAGDLHVVVLDDTGAVVSGAPVGPNFEARAAAAPIVLHGEQIGTLLVGRPGGATGTAAVVELSHLWFLAAAAVAAAAALVVAYVLTRRMIRPLDSYIAAARAFADGDRAARPQVPGPPEFRDLTRALAAAADQVEQSEQARQRLTADIAHELRTPPAALQAGFEELRDGHVEPDRQVLSALHDQSARLGRIVNDLTALSAEASDTLDLHIGPTDLGDEVAMAAAAWEATLESAGIAALLELEPGVRVLADSDRLHQIVGNLLANVANHCRSGDTVSITVAQDRAAGLLRIADDGPGFAADDLPHVFERSWRGRGSQRTAGSGLGLPIVRTLAHAQGGSVAIESQEGRGATVTVRLPLAQPCQ